jgi:uncharacterized protein (DUF1015 family)
MPPHPDAALRLEPFHGVRYAPALDLAAVTAPPYDVLDDEAVAALDASDPHNVVRLVLPRAADRAARNAKARTTLDQWLADGTLLVDAVAGLYVYEQAAGPVVRLRGLIGALGLHDPADHVVLPHEDVMPWPVEDRAALQQALEAHVEPIWLVYDGGGPASAVVDAALTRPSCVDTATADGVRHRLWAITDESELAAVRDDLAGRQALIADGHHRYAAYRRVQAARHEAGDGAGPWDFGLTLLVDLRSRAPEVGAIHRVVRGVRLSDLAADGVRVADGWPAALARLDQGSLLLVDADGAAALVGTPGGGARKAAFAGTDGEKQPPRWQALDTALLHEVLLPTWGVPEFAVSYHHDAAGAVRAAARDGGVAVLLAPVDVADVLALAAEGVRMPRKSTSFGPKPRSGFVLRTFAEG